MAMRIAMYWGLKKTTAFSITVYSITLILMGRISRLLFAFISIAFLGAGYGVCMVTTLYAGWTYYPKNKGTITGIMLSSHGFLGIIFNYAVLFLLNPNNKKAAV